jgi:predicted amidohydrolase
MNDTVGRPVRIVSVCFPDGTKSLPEISAVVDREGERGCDLLILPESWPGHTPEPLDGPTVTALRDLARKHQMYLVCPFDRAEGKKRLNTAVLLERDGHIACVYDKVYPYWSEFDYPTATSPGCDAPVYAADFGRVGMAICFDVNFPAVWERLADEGAELVVWPSAYSAGSSLQAHAINHHYYIVTATATRHCLAYDITGEKILSERSPGIQISRLTLDLDRGIYHQNFNMEKRDRLLKDRAGDVFQDKWLDDEQWFVLKARRHGVSVRALAREYGLEELRDYLRRSRREIDRMRGEPFPPAEVPVTTKG